MENKRKLKYLWVYSAADEWTVAWHERNRLRRLERGFDVINFCNTPISLQRRWFPFPELDHLWKTGDRHLFQMYEDLAKTIEGNDVLILYNGANLHPDFISSFKNILKVYTFGDPECSEILAKPLSPYFDIHLVNQMSEIEKFKNWGLSNVNFWPLGSLISMEDIQDVNEERILDINNRPIKASLFCENNSWRSDRLVKLYKAFPDAIFSGNGWERGFTDWDQMWKIYKKTQIGWNIHNTTGFNFRTFDLLSMGVMQICDNKTDLGKILVDGKEVIGFNTIHECIELTEYYLAHPKEQREIALAGWKRWQNDYSPDKIWDKLTEIVDDYLNSTNDFSGKVDTSRIVISLRSQKNYAQLRSYINKNILLIYRLFQKLIGFIKKSNMKVLGKNKNL